MTETEETAQQQQPSVVEEAATVSLKISCEFQILDFRPDPRVFHRRRSRIRTKMVAQRRHQFVRPVPRVHCQSAAKSSKA